MYNPVPVADDKRNIMREVALTYRRVDRERKRAGDPPPIHHAAAVDAAIAAYQRLDPDASTDRTEASREALRMIANAIHANVQWFWHGPDV